MCWAMPKCRGWQFKRVFPFSPLNSHCNFVLLPNPMYGMEEEKDIEIYWWYPVNQCWWVWWLSDIPTVGCRDGGRAPANLSLWVAQPCIPYQSWTKPFNTLLETRTLPPLSKTKNCHCTSVGLLRSSEVILIKWVSPVTNKRLELLSMLSIWILDKSGMPSCFQCFLEFKN